MESYSIDGLTVLVQENKWNIFHYKVLEGTRVVRESVCYPCMSAEQAAKIAAGNYRRETSRR